MNDRSTPPLDTFETALLIELKSVVRETATVPPARAPLGPARFGQRLRWYAPAAGLVAAALAVVLLAVNLWPTPAYAVSGGHNEKVTVRVNRLEGAEGLEQALRKRGIPADVTYLPAGKQCAPGRYAWLRTPGLTLSVSAKRFEVTIPPNSVGKDNTFVLSAAVVVIPDGVRASVEFDIATGPVRPCRVVDAP